MDVSTINQLIDTAGLFFSPIVAISLAYILSKRLIRTKSNVQREIDYLKGALFLYEVINRYKEELKRDGKGSNYIKFRESEEKTLGYKPEEICRPAAIRKRLSELGELSENIDSVISKVEKI
jgi:hypothetical protein